jgi:hypothetical protein
MKSWLLAVAALALAAGCASQIAARVAQNDFALVQEGRYPGRARIANGDPALEKLVKPWRAEIEGNPELLRAIAEKYFSLPEESHFKYMYVGEDASADQVVLRYFAHDPHPIIMAGWQIFLVFDRRAKSLAAVYASEVPLED